MAGDDGGSGFGALLLGVGVGLAVGFLCAPESREETRKIIASSRYFSHLGKKAMKFI